MTDERPESISDLVLRLQRENFDLRARVDDLLSQATTLQEQNQVLKARDQMLSETLKRLTEKLERYEQALLAESAAETRVQELSLRLRKVEASLTAAHRAIERLSAGPTERDFTARRPTGGFEETATAREIYDSALLHQLGPLPSVSGEAGPFLAQPPEDPPQGTPCEDEGYPHSGIPHDHIPPRGP